MDYINETVIAVISALIGGFVTYSFDRKKESRKEKKDLLAKLEEQRKNRPEFLITNMKDSFNRPGTCIDTQPCDIEIYVAGIKKVNIKDEIVFAEYEDSIFDKKTWVCRQYTLKNVGKTVVYGVDIISNYKKDTCIFNVKAIDEKVIKLGILNYSVLLDKRIAPDESFTLKLCYDKEKIITGFVSAIFEIGMRDDNGINWVQPFFAPENKLYESRKISYQEYRENLLPDIAIECFQKPYLW